MEALFLAHLPVIERAAAHACRRYGLSPEDVEDFTQHVKTKILSDDYAVLRKFREASSLKGYLGVVVQKALQDFMDHRWGKWRPSAEARRLGRLAERLEALLVRDHLSYREASQLILTEEQGRVAASDLERISAQLRPRTKRGRDVSLDGGAAEMAGGSGARAALEPAAPDQADDRVLAAAAQARWEYICRALAEALASLDSDEDRLIAKTVPELGVATTSRVLGLEQKALYRRSKAIFRRLEEILKAAGVSGEEVASILGGDHE